MDKNHPLEDIFHQPNDQFELGNFMIKPKMSAKNIRQVQKTSYFFITNILSTILGRKILANNVCGA